MAKLLWAFLFTTLATAQSWTPQTSNTTASLRGVSAVNDRVVWASGTGGTYLHTTDGGATWIASKVAGAESQDFRAIRAIDERTVYLMSIGSGDKSRVYKTTDAGEHWTLLFTQPDPAGFFDAIAFWDATHGILVGDALGGTNEVRSAEVRTTEDGGLHWKRQQTPPAIDKEGSFAASNSCVFVRGSKDAWYVTGGPGAGRVFHSRDNGRHWNVVPTPIRNDGAAAGLFSIAFSDVRHGMAVGGDYSKDKENKGNIVVTADGGKTWLTPDARPAGFRSAVVYLPDRQTSIVTGTSGSDISTDFGATWKAFDNGSYNAMSFVRGGVGWAVGARGRVAKFKPE